VVSDSAPLEMWAVGITGKSAEAFSLGNDGVVFVDGYDYVYLMVFDPEYDDDLTECIYNDYTLIVNRSNTPAAPAAFKLDASQFAPLESD
jgi:hypothetical protein